jgi:hypothetical protein
LMNSKFFGALAGSYGDCGFGMMQAPGFQTVG